MWPEELVRAIPDPPLPPVVSLGVGVLFPVLLSPRPVMVVVEVDVPRELGVLLRLTELARASATERADKLVLERLWRLALNDLVRRWKEES